MIIQFIRLVFETIDKHGKDIAFALLIVFVLGVVGAMYEALTRAPCKQVEIVEVYDCQHYKTNESCAVKLKDGRIKVVDQATVGQTLCERDGEIE